MTHCFAARHGGVSASPCDSLNLALHVKDEHDSVLENRRKLASSMGLAPLKITTAEQIHSNSVAIIRASDAGSGAESFTDSICDTDALITNVKSIPLTLFFADCVPVFILDPVNQAIGLAHAGWKGTALKIASETLIAMKQAFKTDPDHCLAAIGPSIGRCCYDVSEEVSDRVVSAAQDIRVAARIHTDHSRLDLKMANWAILRAAGVQEKNIAISPLCTACESDFFSYRRDGTTGRMAAVIALR